MLDPGLACSRHCDVPAAPGARPVDADERQGQPQGRQARVGKFALRWRARPGCRSCARYIVSVSHRPNGVTRTNIVGESFERDASDYCVAARGAVLPRLETPHVTFHAARPASTSWLSLLRTRPTLKHIAARGAHFDVALAATPGHAQRALEILLHLDLTSKTRRDPRRARRPPPPETYLNVTEPRWRAHVAPRRTTMHDRAPPGSAAMLARLALDLRARGGARSAPRRRSSTTTGCARSTKQRNHARRARAARRRRSVRDGARRADARRTRVIEGVIDLQRGTAIDSFVPGDEASQIVVAEHASNAT